MKLNFTINNTEYAIKLAKRRKRTKPIQGYTNRCKDGKFITVIDYDTKKVNWIIDEIEHIQKEYKLGDFYFFETNKGYHTVCFDKVTLKEYINILNRTSVDPDYVKIPLKYGERLWTLRHSKKSEMKPRFTFVLNSKTPESRIKSHPHIKFIEQLHNIQINYQAVDDQEKMIVSSYKW